MAVRSEASAKLSKAEEFLLVADTALTCECYDASVSTAVSAAINAADVLCLEVLGAYSTGPSHELIFSMLRKCGTSGESVARHFRPILKLKIRAQYSADRCKEKDAQDVYRHAERILTIVKAFIDSK
jgi:uncharacterized protein (UPF0332 family)